MKGNRVFILSLCFVLLVSVGSSLFAQPDKGQIVERLEQDIRLFTIEVREADIRDVLRALAQQNDLNIIIGEGVEGKITLTLKNITFKDALEVILRAYGLAYKVQNNVLWVGKEGDIKEEVVVETIRLNYADPQMIVSQLKPVLSDQGSAVHDERTSSVIVKDALENIEKARDLIRTLDVQSEQVLIEARIVEANTNFTKQLGIQWGGQYASGGDVMGGSSLLQNQFAERNFVVNMPADTPTSGLGLVIGSLTDNLVLDVELSAAESEGQLKIISSPKIFTLNNESATIHSGLTFRVKLSQALLTGQQGGYVTTTTGVGGAYTGLEEIKTGIDLTVTPSITSDGYILLKIDTNKSDPDFSHTVDGIPGVSEKSASTNVLVKDGDTIVIGGLYKSISSEQDNKVPFFGEIPILGWLFRSETRTTQNEELLVFITPRIVKFDTNGEVAN